MGCQSVLYNLEGNLKRKSIFNLRRGKAGSIRLWFIEVKPVLSSYQRYWEIFSVPFLLAFNLNVTLSNSGI
jgi:hypothetical protein